MAPGGSGGESLVTKRLPPFKLYVEGGGSGGYLRTECRRAFSEFLKKSGIKSGLPRVVACGSRSNAYQDFCTAIGNGELAILLVDSECAVFDKSVWDHLKNRKGDGWTRPDKIKDDQCHLMIQCMESWFLADIDAVSGFYGKSFNAGRLPKNQPEEVAKEDLFNALNAAIGDGDGYKKGRDSFRILEKIDTEKVCEKCPSAKAFIGAVKKYSKKRTIGKS